MSDLGTHGATTDGERLELVEAERAAAAAGYDTDAQLDDDGRAACPNCGAPNELGGLLGGGQDARDTTTDRHELEVLSFRCGRCDTALRVVVDPSELEPVSDPPVGSGGPATSTADTSGEPTPGGRPGVQSDDRPVSHASFADEVDRFEPTSPGSLRDHGSLIDEDGDDIRMYTGEPVETDEGWVLPVQQNFAGRDNIAGGGEWPDPDAEPAQSRPVDADDSHAAPFTPTTRQTYRDGDTAGDADDSVATAEPDRPEPGQDLPERN